VLDDLAGVLHRLQLIQLIPGYRLDEEADGEALHALAARIAPEDVQLYYQIAIGGRRDLALAPDARTGFEMALLRMLAFRPGDEASRPAAERATPAPRPAAPPARGAAPVAPPAPAYRAASPAPAAAPAVRESTPAAPVRDAGGLPHWESLIEQAGLRGPFSVLAQNAVLRERDGNTLVLALQPAHMGMAVEPMVSQMEERISQALGERVRLRFVDIDMAAVAATPAARATQARNDAQAAAEQSIEDDPFVQSMKRDFGARVVPQSVKPLNNPQ